MGRRKKKAAGPDTPKRKKMEKQLQLDVIMREAAAIVLAEIRKMKDAQVKDDGGKKISATELPSLVNLLDVALRFQARLEAVGSTVDALAQRLRKWRIRGVDDDPVTSRGRPRSRAPSPITSRTVAMVANRSQGHLGNQAVLAVVGDRMETPSNGANPGLSKSQQMTIFQTMRQEANVIKGRAKPMTPVLLHASTSPAILGKFHQNMQAAFRKVPIFASEPMRICDMDEANKADRAGRDGRVITACTTVERIKKKGYQMLRPLSLNDSYEGPSSSCNWILASGDLLAKTPICKAPPGYVIPEDFSAPPEWTMPATHGGEPFLPGMSKDYFTKGNSRVYCTASGSNNAACFAHMFMHTTYPLWRAKVPDGPLMLVYDSCHAHNWTEELASFCGNNDVHIVKLFHNTTTRTAPLDCGFNLAWREIVHTAQDNIVAAGLFKHAYLDRSMRCKFTDIGKRTRKSPMRECKKQKK
jgi:hypothetical protein